MHPALVWLQLQLLCLVLSQPEQLGVPGARDRLPGSCGLSGGGSLLWAPGVRPQVRYITGGGGGGSTGEPGSIVCCETFFILLF